MSGFFGGLGAPDLAETTTDPKRLFRALPKPSGSPFVFPHDIQSEVWDKWFARRNESDLVIKMNTGSGKTVIGLVILKSSLNEGRGPAVYLVPDTQLESQVRETADALGIAWTDDPRDAVFRQGQAVLVVTAHTMYNGLSKFGLQGQGGRSIEVGSIVVDDAHACIPIFQNQFSLTVDRHAHPTVWDVLFDRFSDQLKEQSLAGWSGLADGTGTQAVPLPYWAWQANLEEVFRILDGLPDESDAKKFNWPLIRDQLRLCDVAFTPGAMQVRLPYPDLGKLPSFKSARRRIYMTATLADDSVLVTQMGAADQSVTAPITPSSASDIGDRLILTPIETSRNVSVDDVKASAARWAQSQNVVVIVPSNRRAEQWNHLTSEIHERRTIRTVVARLKSGEHVGLVVLVARYDGVDLPNGACRVLILDGLPERYSPVELVEAVALGGTAAMDSRQTQRIEQGMGRGVRSTDDYCAVILLDPRLVERLFAASDRRKLSPATRAQYDLSMQFASRGRGQSMSYFEGAVNAFLARDTDWVRASKQALEAVTYEHADSVPAAARAERDSFALALASRFVEAKELLAGALTEVDSATRGWLKQRAATYLNATDPAAARELQRSARIDNNFILKIPHETATTRVTAVGDQAAASVGYMTAEFATARTLEVAVEALLLDLVPSTTHNSHKQFEAALQRLGRLLGFASSRPDQETGIGPDNLWAIGNDRYWVIECKSEATVDEVSRKYLEQLSHSTDWFDSAYPEARYFGVPLMIHPSRQPMWDAVARQGARALTFARLEQLRTAVSSFAGAIQIGDGFRDATIVGRNLTQFGLSSSQLEQRWTESFSPSSPHR
ncbi:helicase C-terminal domain-containing protein [Rathayibacter sp. AY1A7]|uniref:helicase C-terminal domain-containing protein n=1 Tax=Rathayibacter sp. AY1A7 TaxID=2080524 RepID=UPI0015E3A4A1|nr:helicase C-terminal domain-containing protein [Rathayibacter sp. AY1A7]